MLRIINQHSTKINQINSNKMMTDRIPRYKKLTREMRVILTMMHRLGHNRMLLQRRIKTNKPNPHCTEKERLNRTITRSSYLCKPTTL